MTIESQIQAWASTCAIPLQNPIMWQGQVIAPCISWSLLIAVGVIVYLILKYEGIKHIEGNKMLFWFVIIVFILWLLMGGKI